MRQKLTMCVVEFLAHFHVRVLECARTGTFLLLLLLGVKPAFHGACFGAVSAPILSARITRRASAAFEKERYHYEHREGWREGGKEGEGEWEGTFLSYLLRDLTMIQCHK